MFLKILFFIFIPIKITITYLIYRIYHNYDQTIKIICRNLIYDINKLGPIYLKILQILSSRSDLFNKTILQYLSKVQDSLPAEKIYSYNDDANYDLSIIEKLDFFDQNPISAGTIAQVHRGNYNGNNIILKIKRKNIDLQIKKNINEIQYLINILNNFPYLRTMNLQQRFNQICELFIKQANFIEELENCNNFYNKVNILGINNIIIPKPYNELSNNNVIIMEYIDAYKINNSKLSKEKKKKLARYFVEFILITQHMFNMIHGDLHPGNILISSDKIYILDFGIVYYIPQKLNKKNKIFTKYLCNKSYNDFSNLTFDYYIENCKISKKKFVSELNCILPVICEKDLNFIYLTRAMTKFFNKYNIKFKSDFANLEAAIITSEGLCKTISADCDFWGLIKEIMDEL